MLLSFTDTFFRKTFKLSKSPSRYCTGTVGTYREANSQTKFSFRHRGHRTGARGVPAPPGVFLPAYGTGTHHRCANSHAVPARRRWMTCRPRLCLRSTQTSSNGPECSLCRRLTTRTSLRACEVLLVLRGRSAWRWYCRAGVVNLVRGCLWRA